LVFQFLCNTFPYHFWFFIWCAIQIYKFLFNAMNFMKILSQQEVFLVYPDCCHP
jgi:hypothetical protein